MGWIRLSWLVLIFTESVKSGVTPAHTVYGAWAGVMSGTRYHSSFLCCQKRLAFVGLHGALQRGAKMALEDSRACPQEQDWSCVEAQSGFLLYLWNYSTLTKEAVGCCSPALWGSLSSSSHTDLLQNPSCSNLQIRDGNVGSSTWEECKSCMYCWKCSLMVLLNRIKHFDILSQVNDHEMRFFL